MPDYQPNYGSYLDFESSQIAAGVSPPKLDDAKIDIGEVAQVATRAGSVVVQVGSERTFPLKSSGFPPDWSFRSGDTVGVERSSVGDRVVPVVAVTAVEGDMMTFYARSANGDLRRLSSRSTKAEP